jgi:hypothetical protein
LIINSSYYLNHSPSPILHAIPLQGEAFSLDRAFFHGVSNILTAQVLDKEPEKGGIKHASGGNPVKIGSGPAAVTFTPFYLQRENP